MKKFLLSLFCTLMAFTSIQAEEKTYTYEHTLDYNSGDHIWEPYHGPSRSLGPTAIALALPWLPGCSLPRLALDPGPGTPPRVCDVRWPPAISLHTALHISLSKTAASPC